MSTAIRSVFIVAKGDNSRAMALGEEVQTFLKEQGVSTDLCRHVKGEEPCMKLDVDNQHDLVLLLGGDGTFIAAARRLLPYGIPLMGVNLGQVGFLTELSPDTWRETLSDVLKGGIPSTPDWRCPIR